MSSDPAPPAPSGESPPAPFRPRVAFLAAGAAGMICGSCMRDAAAVRAMKRLGAEVELIPLYTPLRVDGPSGEYPRVFFGGINVYLEQKLPWFRRLPRWMTRPLDSRLVLNLSSKLAGMTQAKELGELAVSILRGEEGHQRREAEALADWLAGEFRPSIVNLPNAMFAGVARLLKERTGAPVVCSLTGEDLFLDGLIEPYRSEAAALVREKAAHVDRFVAISRYYADEMAPRLGVPRERIAVVPIGIDPDPYMGRTGPPDGPFTIGFLARLAPEKGLHVLLEAFRILRKLPGGETARLRAAGWTGREHAGYVEDLRRRVSAWGLGDAARIGGELTFAEKLEFLRGIHVLSVPAVYRDPKGLFVLEALAGGVPAVLPRHGAFPELIEALGGGLLHEPEDPEDLARALQRLAANPEETARLGLRGREMVRTRFTATAMARGTLEVYEALTAGGR